MTKRLAEGESKTVLAKEFGVDRVTVYRYIARSAKKPLTRTGAKVS